METKMENLLPVMLRLAGQKVVVVGGGEVAFQKVTQLLECDACVTVVSPKLGWELATLNRRFYWKQKEYEPADLEGAVIVFACTDDPSVNDRVYRDCQERGLWCNVADDPERCRFFMPALFRRGPVTVALSTSGTSPSLARRMRIFLEEIFGDGFGMLAFLLGDLKETIRQALPSFSDRRLFMDRVWNSPIWDLLEKGDRQGAENLLKSILSELTLKPADQEASQDTVKSPAESAI
ncbi:MAG: bifunctional precorrin-2 dehydrogenase/sirohydrochlorin ferrochelatase [Armatimonadetes bacterium]|nr:bifunctional precorrin-2 dehydrogenase/sirohydrochlorin ferrochelatase [Armatimonadota bacterium]MDW8121338.1 bifunctional precorrin-2 dehydrogenase/sirohydrochlorin ferrochelatase [Armatimonadota bacterium]